MIVVFNPLSHVCQPPIHLFVTTPFVQVTDSFGHLVVTQTNLVWRKEESERKLFEVTNVGIIFCCVSDFEYKGEI